MESSLLEVKIAFAFPQERHSEIVGYVNLISLNKAIQVRIIASYNELVLFKPTIVVSNQYDWSLEYCKNYLNVKWLHLMSSGVDNAISILQTREHSLILTNIKGIHKEIMSNYILSWILNDSLNILEYINNQKNKKWVRYRSTSLQGKNALIFGFGNIGCAIANKLSIFGIKSIGVNTNTKVIEINDSIITIPFTNVFDYLNNIDYIIITAPLTKLNYKFFDADFFKKLNSTPILINISRAELVDSNSLVNAINNRVISKAILDVHYSEPLEVDSKFWETENIYITPHISGYFIEGMKLGFLKFQDLLIEYQNNGISNSNRVSFTKGY